MVRSPLRRRRPARPDAPDPRRQVSRWTGRVNGTIRVPISLRSVMPPMSIADPKASRRHSASPRHRPRTPPERRRRCAVHRDRREAVGVANSRRVSGARGAALSARPPGSGERLRLRRAEAGSETVSGVVGHEFFDDEVKLLFGEVEEVGIGEALQQPGHGIPDCTAGRFGAGARRRPDRRPQRARRGPRPRYGRPGRRGRTGCRAPARLRRRRPRAHRAGRGPCVPWRPCDATGGRHERRHNDPPGRRIRAPSSRSCPRRRAHAAPHSMRSTRRCLDRFGSPARGCAMGTSSSCSSPCTRPPRRTPSRFPWFAALPHADAFAAAPRNATRTCWRTARRSERTRSRGSPSALRPRK